MLGYRLADAGGDQRARRIGAQSPAKSCLRQQTQNRISDGVSMRFCVSLEIR
jgi:hypothetical protein